MASGGGGADSPRALRRVSTRKTSAPATASSSVGVFGSTFAKTGGESYLLGVGTLHEVAEEDAVGVEDDEGGVPRWQRRVGDYQVQISSPKKEDKYYGMKSFISYQLSSSFTERPVGC